MAHSAQVDADLERAAQHAAQLLMDDEQVSSTCHELAVQAIGINIPGEYVVIGGDITTDRTHIDNDGKYVVPENDLRYARYWEHYSEFLVRVAYHVGVKLTPVGNIKLQHEGFTAPSAHSGDQCPTRHDPLGPEDELSYMRGPVEL